MHRNIFAKLNITAIYAASLQAVKGNYKLALYGVILSCTAIAVVWVYLYAYQYFLNEFRRVDTIFQNIAGYKEGGGLRQENNAAIRYLVDQKNRHPQPTSALNFNQNEATQQCVDGGSSSRVHTEEHGTRGSSTATCWLIVHPGPPESSSNEVSKTRKAENLSGIEDTVNSSTVGKTKFQGNISSDPAAEKDNTKNPTQLSAPSDQNEISSDLISEDHDGQSPLKHGTTMNQGKTLLGAPETKDEKRESFSSSTLEPSQSTHLPIEQSGKVARNSQKEPTDGKPNFIIISHTRPSDFGNRIPILVLMAFYSGASGNTIKQTTEFLFFIRLDQLGKGSQKFYPCDITDDFRVYASSSQDPYPNCRPGSSSKQRSAGPILIEASRKPSPAMASISEPNTITDEFTLKIPTKAEESTPGKKRLNSRFKLMGYKTALVITDTKLIIDALTSAPSQLDGNRSRLIALVDGFSDVLARAMTWDAGISVYIYSGSEANDENLRSFHRASDGMRADTSRGGKFIAEWASPIIGVIARRACEEYTANYHAVDKRPKYICGESNFETREITLYRIEPYTKEGETALFEFGIYIPSASRAILEDLKLLFFPFAGFLILVAAQQRGIFKLKYLVDIDWNRNDDFVKIVNHDLNKHWPLLKEALEATMHPKKDEAIFAANFIERILERFRIERSKNPASDKEASVSASQFSTVEDSLLRALKKTDGDFYALGTPEALKEMLVRGDLLTATFRVQAVNEDIASSTVKAHRVDVYFILLQLLQNTKNHGVLGQPASIHIETSSENCLITISNQTEIIPPRELRRLHKPGVSIRRGHRTHRGTGMGLAQARKLAKDCGGELEYYQDEESEYTARFNVTVELPLVRYA